MLNLIIGEKNRGKTQHLHQTLKNHVTDGEEAVLLVPMHFTFDTDKSILHTLGPQKASEVQVLSFSRLADTVIKNYGGITKPVLTKGAKNVFIALAIKQVKDELEIFSKQKNEFNLIGLVTKAIDDVEKSGIDLDVLQELTQKLDEGTLKQKMRAVMLVTQAYQALVGQSYFDEAKMLDKVREILEHEDFFKDKVVAIDGFHDFSKVQRDLIQLMLRQAKCVYITVCSGDIYNQSPLSPFKVSNDSAKKLIECAKKVDSQVKIYCDLSLGKCGNKTDEQSFANQVYSLSQSTFDAPDGTKIIQASSIHIECDAVAAKIKQFAIENSVRYRDVMVIYPNEDLYAQKLNFAFKRYGLPLFQDKRQPIENQPLIILISNLLKICEQGFNTDLIFRYLKSGITNVSKEDISELENYVFMWDIDHKQWLEPFKDNTRGFGASVDENTMKQLLNIERIRGKVMTPILNFKEKFKDLTCIQGLNLIFNFLIDNGIDQGLKTYAMELEKSAEVELAKEQEQVWDLVMEVLDELAFSLNEKALGAKDFSQMFDLVVKSKTLGKLPDGFDHVTVCDIKKATVKKAKVVFLVGLNDTVLPKSKDSSGLFSESEKAMLNLLLQDGDYGFSRSIIDENYEERFLIYSALASAESELFLSYSLSANSGERLESSSIIKRFFECYPNYEKADAITEKSIDDLVYSEQVAFEMFAKTLGDNEAATAALREYFHENMDYKQRVSKIVNSREKKLEKINDTQLATELFGEKLRLSASRIEDYNKCPYMYFCKFGLGVRPRKKAEFDPMQSGTVVHYVLERLLAKYPNKAFLHMSSYEIKTDIKFVLDEYITLYMGGTVNRDARFVYLYQRMTKVIEDIFLRLKIEFKNSDYEPWKYELEIINDGEVQPIKVELENGFVELSGIVDRVDKMDKDGKRYIRIIDYKTGNKKFELFEVENGLNMQMLLYLMAIWRSENPEFKDCVPAGVLYYPAKTDSFVSRRGLDEETALKSRLKSNCKMNGMLLYDEVSIEGMDKTSEFLLLPIKPKTQEPETFMLFEDLDKICGEMNEIIMQVGNMLHGGKICSLPVEVGTQSHACDFCEYKSACQREKVHSRKISKKTKLSIEDAIKEVENCES